MKALTGICVGGPLDAMSLTHWASIYRVERLSNPVYAFSTPSLATDNKAITGEYHWDDKIDGVKTQLGFWKWKGWKP